MSLFVLVFNVFIINAIFETYYHYQFKMFTFQTSNKVMIWKQFHYDLI